MSNVFLPLPFGELVYHTILFMVFTFSLVRNAFFFRWLKIYLQTNCFVSCHAWMMHLRCMTMYHPTPFLPWVALLHVLHL